MATKRLVLHLKIATISTKHKYFTRIFEPILPQFKKLQKILNAIQQVFQMKTKEFLFRTFSSPFNIKLRLKLDFLIFLLDFNFCLQI